MFRTITLGLVTALTLSTSAARAANTIVDLNASSTDPNAGFSSPGYAYNPVTMLLAAGTYSVRVIGVAQGGAYDAYSVYAPTPINGAFTDSAWSVSLNNTSAAYTQGSIGRFNTAAAAQAAYSPLGGYTFTINTAQNVEFYVDDTAYPYFGDDSGGVSLLVSQVPEPATIGLLGFGVVGMVLMMRNRKSAPAA